jgi:hypothetical protein
MRNFLYNLGLLAIVRSLITYPKPKSKIMKTNTLIIIAAAIGFTGLATAEEKKRPIRPDNRVEKEDGKEGRKHPDRPFPREVMEKFDKDGDGKLNEQERAAAKEAMKAREEAYKKEMLAKFDKDGDGELNEEEREAAKKEREAKHEAHKKEMLAKYDKDGDGELNEEEKKAMHKDQKGKHPGGPDKRPKDGEGGEGEGEGGGNPGVLGE